MYGTRILEQLRRLMLCIGYEFIRPQLFGEGVLGNEDGRWFRYLPFEGWDYRLRACAEEQGVAALRCGLLCGPLHWFRTNLALLPSFVQGSIISCFSS